MTFKSLSALCFLGIVCALAGCGGGSSNSPVSPGSNPVPTVTSLSPSSLVAGASSQTLTINGTGFLSSSTVTFNGAAHAATYVSASQITISLTTADLASGGSYPVIVTNPPPGGGPSATVNFTVSASNPVPTVTSLSPASLPAGATPQTLSINGTGFLPASAVTFNGVPHAAAYVSATQLTISLTTADLATVGSYPVVVTNPAPGGGSSTAVNFAVSAKNPVPSITSLSPASLAVGASPQALTINGTGFLTTSTVTFNGVSHAPTYVSASQLTISITSADLATAGSYPVVVTNPAPGGGASVAAIFAVTPAGSEPGLVRVTNDSATDDHPAWSPTTGLIAFSSSPGGQDSDIWEVSPSGTSLQQLTTGVHGNYGGGLTYPVWLGSTGDLVVQDNVFYWEWDRLTLSTNPPLPVDHSVANGSQPDFDQLLFVPGGLGGQSFTVSPDGTNAAWDALTTLTGQCPSNTDLHIAPLSSMNGQDNNTYGQIIASFTLNCSVGNMDSIVGLSFSPDGSQLVVGTLSDPNSYAFDISIYKLDGTQVRQLTTTGAGANHVVNWQPSWSSDNRIAFSSNSSGEYQVYTINSDGSNLTQVTTNGGAWPSWAPDASSITFSSSRSGNSQIYVIPPPAGGSGTITSVSPSCSPQSITIGQSSACNASVAGTGTYHSSVNWSVSPTSIGSISGAGVFTPATTGTATIAATSQQDPTKSGSTTVVVVASGNPVPAVTSLTPASVAVGAPAQTLTINGIAFLTTSTVTYNNVAHAATYVSASQLAISLTTADLATAGSYPVVVTNPTPGGGSSAALNFTVTAGNPVPAITSLSPSSLPVGSAAQTLTINGTGFLSSSTVTFNSTAHTASFVSASQLTIPLTTADLATAGSDPVVVTNPAPGGGASPAFSFTVTAINPAPTISSLSPPSLPAGAAAQTLTINGTGFLSSSTVTFNSIAHTATFVNSSQLTIPLTATDLATAGSYPVVVTNPAPGGGASPAANFTVTAINPAPTISLLNPASLAAGAEPQVLTITGTGFLTTSKVTFNGVNHTATYVSAGQLTIALTTSDLATAGSYAVVVTNPAPGGGASTPANFTVTTNNPVPTLSNISPDSVAAGAPDTSIEVVGTGYTPQSVVYFDSLALQTSYVSSTQLSAVIPSAQIASAGTIAVTVTTTGAGGGTSSAAQFTVTPAIAANNLVILGTPVYSGSPSGPWMLSVAAADSNGNPLPNLPITLNSSEGTISQDSATTDSTGTMMASITPPSSYSGEAVEVSAVSGNQTAVIDIVFAASVAPASSAGQQAAAFLAQKRAKSLHSYTLLPSDSTTSNTTDSGIQPITLGSSNLTAPTNPILGLKNPCVSNQGLDTTISTDCQDLFNGKQLQFTPYSTLNSYCDVLDNVETVAWCGTTAAAVMSACVAVADVPGALVCSGKVILDSKECLGSLASQAVKAVNNPVTASQLKTGITVISIDDINNPALLDKVDVACDLIDYKNAVNEVTVTPTNEPTLTTAPSLQLGDSIDLTASKNVDWSLMGNQNDNSYGALTNQTSNTVTYTAPSVAPNYCGLLRIYYSGSCPITIAAKVSGNQSDYTFYTVLLSIGDAPTAPSILYFAPKSIVVGSPAQDVYMNGSGFMEGDTATYEGSSRVASFISTTQMKVSLLASDFAVVGSYPVVVTHSFLSLANYGGSASANLSVTTAPTPIPPVPQPQSPGGTTPPGDSINTTMPVLQWTGSGASQYSLAISKAPYGTSNIVYPIGPVVIDGSENSLQVPGGYLQSGTSYRWNMVAINSAGTSSVSPSLYFTVNAGALPDKPSNVSPGYSSSPGPAVSSTAQTLTWTGSGATTYELAISRAPYGASKVFYDQAGIPSNTTSWPLPSGTLQDGVSYAWNVQATNSAGQSEWSTASFFTVNDGSGGPPAVPTTLLPGASTSPGQTVTILTPTLTWGASQGATAYTVGVSQLNGGVVYSANVSTNSAPIPSGKLTNGATYFWTVSASNSAGSSTTAPIVYFTVNIAATPSVSGVLPSPVPAANSTQTLTINGSNFVSGATANYYDPVNGTSYNNRPLNFVSSNQLTDSAFNDGGDASASWTVTVVNPGSVNSTPYTFTVAKPSVTQVQTVPVPATGSHQLTISGSNFVSGATLSYYDPVNKVTYSNRTATFNSSSQLTDPAFNAGGDASPNWTVTVVNPGSVSSNAFTFQVQ